jgi:hypothetical protein
MLMGPFFCVLAGFNVAVFAGVTTFTGCYFQVGTFRPRHLKPLRVRPSFIQVFSLLVLRSITVCIMCCCMQENNGAVGFNGAGQAFSVIGTALSSIFCQHVMMLSAYA